MDQAILDNPNVRAGIQQLADLPAEVQHQQVIGWLLGSDAGFRAAAREIVMRTGEPAVAMLLQAAFAKGRRTRDCVKLLQVVEEIGQPLDARRFFDLQIMARRYGSSVRQQIGRVLLANRRANSSAGHSSAHEWQSAAGMPVFGSTNWRNS
jgi:hypothetical protein